MNFNFIPTDNLYKFMALSGLFILVFNLYYSGEEVFKVEEEKIKFSQQQNQVISILSDLYTKLELSNNNSIRISNTYNKRIGQSTNLVAELEKLEASKKNGGLSLANIERIERSFNDSLKRFKVLIDTLYSQRRAIDHQVHTLQQKNDSAQAELDYTEKLLKLKISKYQYYKDLLFYGSIIASMITVVGFFKWFELQQKMDQLLFKRSPPTKTLYGKRNVKQKA